MTRASEVENRGREQCLDPAALDPLVNRQCLGINVDEGKCVDRTDRAVFVPLYGQVEVSGRRGQNLDDDARIGQCQIVRPVAGCAAIDGEIGIAHRPVLRPDRHVRAVGCAA